MERRVQCVDEQGDAFNDTQCAGVRPADQLQCNVLPCDFCSLTNCAGQVLTWRELRSCHVHRHHTHTQLELFKMCQLSPIYCTFL